MGFGQVEPDFGVIAEVNVQPGLNTFKIQGLGRFTDIDQLAGHGCLVSILHEDEGYVDAIDDDVNNNNNLNNNDNDDGKNDEDQKRLLLVECLTS